jgi:hypothetical protein
MKKPFFFLSIVLIGLVSCTRKFSCDCDYKQRAIIINDQGNEEEVRTDEKYSSTIMYTSKKLANEECTERGRSIELDTMRIEASCIVTKTK